MTDDLRRLWPLVGFRRLFTVRLVSQCADGMFQVGLATLFFFSPEKAAEVARSAMAMETKLAQASLTRVDKRDPYKIYHRMKVGELERLAPSLRWKEYFARQGVAKLATLNVSEPAFMKEMDRLVREEPLDAWKAWLRVRVAMLRAPYLSKPFQQEFFTFCHVCPGHCSVKATVEDGKVVDVVPDKESGLPNELCPVKKGRFWMWKRRSTLEWPPRSLTLRRLCGASSGKNWKNY